jgi:hypothetical protein
MNTPLNFFFAKFVPLAPLRRIHLSFYSLQDKSSHSPLQLLHTPFL